MAVVIIVSDNNGKSNTNNNGCLWRAKDKKGGLGLIGGGAADMAGYRILAETYKLSLTYQSLQRVMLQQRVADVSVGSG